MSRIPESAPGYDYYLDAQEELRRQSSDLESSRAKEREIAQARQENDKAASSKSLPETLEKIRNDYEDAFSVARDEYVKASESDRKTSEAYDRQRDELYNRLGETWTRERADYERRMDALGEEARAQDAHHRRLQEPAARNTENKIAEIHRQHAAEVEQVVNDSRAQLRETYRQANATADAGGPAAHARKIASEFEDMNRARNDEIREMRERNNAYAENWDLMGKKREQARKEELETQGQALHALQKRYDEDFQVYKDSVKQEQRQLSQQNRELSSLRDQYEDGFAQGRTEAIQEAAAERKANANRVEDATKAREAQLVRQNNELYDNLGRRNSEAIRDRDSFYADMVRKTNEEYYDDRSLLNRRYSESLDQVKAYQAEREASQEQQYNASLDRFQAQAQEALDNQAEHFRKSAAISKVQNNSEVETLQKKVSHLMSTDDPYDVSPAAADRIRTSMARDHQKTLDAYDEAASAEIDSIRQNAEGDIQELQGTLVQERLKNAQALAQQQKDHNDAFVNFSMDLTDSRDSALNRQAHSHERAWEKVYKNFTNVLKSKDRQMNQAVDDMRDTNHSKVREVKADAEFREREMRSEFRKVQDETIRSFEKKLADQKESYENAIDDLKNEKMVHARRLEKEYQDLLREQEQRHGHEMATAETQRKERERYLAQNFEEQLERVQRTNARLVQAKS